VLEGEDLGTGVDDDIMDTHRVAHPQGVDADLGLFPLAVFVAAHQQLGIGPVLIWLWQVS